eukprot:403374654
MEVPIIKIQELKSTFSSKDVIPSKQNYRQKFQEQLRLKNKQMKLKDSEDSFQSDDIIHDKKDDWDNGVQEPIKQLSSFGLQAHSNSIIFKNQFTPGFQKENEGIEKNNSKWQSGSIKNKNNSDNVQTLLNQEKFSPRQTNDNTCLDNKSQVEEEKLVSHKKQDQLEQQNKQIKKKIQQKQLGQSDSHVEQKLRYQENLKQQRQKEQDYTLALKLYNKKNTTNKTEMARKQKINLKHLGHSDISNIIKFNKDMGYLAMSIFEKFNLFDDLKQCQNQHNESIQQVISQQQILIHRQNKIEESLDEIESDLIKINKLQRKKQVLRSSYAQEKQIKSNAIYE